MCSIGRPGIQCPRLVPIQPSDPRAKKTLKRTRHRKATDRDVQQENEANGGNQRAAGEDEKEIREARVIIQEEPGLGYRDNSLQIISTDTVLVTDTRISVSYNQEHWTSKLSMLDFTSLNYTADRIYF